jgi:hypothetical protein
MANDGNWLTQPIGRALLALAIDLPYALEKPLMGRLLRVPTFEPATPTQLSTIAAFRSRYTAAGANGVPSIMTTGLTSAVRDADVIGRTASGDLTITVPLTPAASRLSAAHRDLCGRNRQLPSCRSVSSPSTLAGP